MAKSVAFNDEYDTYQNWGLHWSDVEITAPEVKANYIEIPGAAAPIDVTEWLVNRTYNNRTITLEFWKNIKEEERITLDSQIQKAIGGQRCKIRLSTDPVNYWEGRVTVTSKMDAVNIALFTIECDVDPYKHDGAGERFL